MNLYTIYLKIAKKLDTISSKLIRKVVRLGKVIKRLQASCNQIIKYRYYKDNPPFHVTHDYIVLQLQWIQKYAAEKIKT